MAKFQVEREDKSKNRDPVRVEYFTDAQHGPSVQAKINGMADDGYKLLHFAMTGSIRAIGIFYKA